MDKQANAYFSDILASIERIESFFEGKQMRYEDYHTDWKLRLAVERSIEIIGEAMNRLLKMDPDIPFPMPRQLLERETGSFMHTMLFRMILSGLSSSIIWVR